MAGVAVNAVARARGAPLVEWGVASLPHGGAGLSGDAAYVEARDVGTLVAVVDALGHGSAADVTARAAVEALARATGSLEAIAAQVHARLGGTRGAVMSLALFRHDEMLEWLGVGNVEGVLWRGRARGGSEGLLARGGIFGYQIPPLRAKRVELAPGDVLVMATDGLSPSFGDRRPPDLEPRAAADALLAEHGRGTDDALVLVARYEGGEPR
jgi:hypothetical protein